MTQLYDQSWFAAQADDFIPGQRAGEARAFWAEHQGAATEAAFAVAVRVVEEMASGTEEQPMGVEPPSPPTQLYAPMGGPGVGEPVAQATWNAIAGVAFTANMDVTDPFLAERLQAISDDHQGGGVYLFSWWAWSAFQHVRSTRHVNGVEVARVAIASRLAGFG